MEERSLLFEYLAIVKRRRWLIAVPIALGLLVGVVLVQILPREYRSSTTLAVTSANMTSDLVKSSPLDLAERARAISQELLSRKVLERVAREEGLASDGRMEPAIASIRARAAVSVPKSLTSNSRTGPDAFLVTYTGPTPEQTQRIANRLAATFIDEHAALRETRAEDTSAFLAAQLTQSRDRLKNVEERLRKIKEAYMGRLPEQTQANLQMVAGLRQQQSNTTMSLRSEQDRLAMLERQIEAMKGIGAEGGSPTAGAATSTQGRIVALRRELDQALAMYTEKHPEIQRLRSEIATAEAQATAEKSAPADKRETALSANPAYRQLLAERDTSRLRIRDHERAVARAEGDIAKYEGRVESAPMIEQQLGSINREYELEKQQYTSLSERHQAAVLGEDLERRRAGEQFAVLYPAYLPSQPSSPDVPRVLLLATLAGIIAAAALTFGREYLDRSIYDARTLQNEFDLPVLAEIPRIATR